jgi:hypothetical protein
MMELNNISTGNRKVQEQDDLSNWLENRRLEPFAFALLRIPLQYGRRRWHRGKMCWFYCRAENRNPEKAIAAGLMDPSHLEHVDASKPDFVCTVLILTIYIL